MDLAEHNCVIYRCDKQAEMYIFLLADLETKDLPEALLKRTGRLTPVMELRLGVNRKLARVDTQTVIDSLTRDGFYLQMPPNGLLEAQLYWGD